MTTCILHRYEFNKKLLNICFCNVVITLTGQVVIFETPCTLSRIPHEYNTIDYNYIQIFFFIKIEIVVKCFLVISFLDIINAIKNNV